MGDREGEVDAEAGDGNPRPAGDRKSQRAAHGLHVAPEPRNDQSGRQGKEQGDGRNGGARQPMFAGLGNMARNAMPGGPMMGAGPRPVPMGGGSAVNNVAIAPADYQAFEQLLKNIQAAWTAQDLAALRAMATPEMVSYFSEQLSDQASRGVRNSVTDVRLEKGDLAEAWSEGSREYATVAMRFSMVDVTRDSTGRIVDGALAERVLATELWTFVRAPGGRWLLSAIQQGR